jgi:hypothetical protein
VDLRIPDQRATSFYLVGAFAFRGEETHVCGDGDGRLAFVDAISPKSLLASAGHRAASRPGMVLLYVDRAKRRSLEAAFASSAVLAAVPAGRCPPGLSNPSAQCYLNAPLQLLASCPSLCTRLAGLGGISSKFSVTANGRSFVLSKKARDLTRVLSTLMQQLQLGSSRVCRSGLSTRGVFDNLSSRHDGGEQDDGATMWGILLSSMVDCLARVNGSSYSLLSELPNALKADPGSVRGDTEALYEFLKEGFVCLQSVVACTECTESDNGRTLLPEVYPALVVSPSAASAAESKTWTQLVTSELQQKGVVDYEVHCEECRSSTAHALFRRTVLHVPTTFAIFLARGAWDDRVRAPFRVRTTV